MRIEQGKMQRIVKPFIGMSLGGHALSDPVREGVQSAGLQNESRDLCSQSRQGPLRNLFRAVMKENMVLEEMARVPHQWCLESENIP